MALNTMDCQNTVDSDFLLLRSPSLDSLHGKVPPSNTTNRSQSMSTSAFVPSETEVDPLAMTAQTATEPKTHSEYTVGWVCALTKERTAATAMLDRRHADLPKPPNDPNAYTIGSVGKHNVVIVCLHKGQVGNDPASAVVNWVISTFPSIKFGLMVGIGGGVPPKVRLGDVVVSTPVGQFSSVV